MTAYFLLKYVHIVSSMLLFGTGLGTAFFMWTSHRTGDVAAIANAARSTVRADWLFTTPAVIVQPATGVALMRLQGYGLDQRWLAVALVLYVAAGACWLPVVALQLRVSRLSAEALRRGTGLDADYARCMRWWFALGWPAFLAVLAITWLMVAKPALG